MTTVATVRAAGWSCSFAVDETDPNGWHGGAGMALVCGSCGESSPDNAEFCLFCGAYLGWSSHRAADADQPVNKTREEPTAPVPAEPQRAAPDPDRASHTPTVLLEPSKDPERACPACGRDNVAARRFCGHCGHQLVPTPVASRLPAPRVTRASSWWGRVVDERERSARQAYRRSLPAVYRWRRVLVGAVVVALLAAFGVVSRGHPVRWTLERWDEVRGTLAQVGQVQVTVEPAEATVPPTAPGLLLDDTEQAWTTSWPTGSAGSGCAPAPSSGTIVLRFPPTRVRAVDVFAGLVDDMPERALQDRPQAFGVAFNGGQCRTLPIENQHRNDKLPLDSLTPVTTMRITVQAAYAAPAGGQELLSITEIRLWSRPARS